MRIWPRTAYRIIGYLNKCPSPRNTHRHTHRTFLFIRFVLIRSFRQSAPACALYRFFFFWHRLRCANQPVRLHSALLIPMAAGRQRQRRRALLASPCRFRLLPPHQLVSAIYRHLSFGTNGSGRTHVSFNKSSAICSPATSVRERFGRETSGTVPRCVAP